eukprot:scaffold2072_cov162-Amphora_coffeaeformis.AAC.7
MVVNDDHSHSSRRNTFRDRDKFATLVGGKFGPADGRMTCDKIGRSKATSQATNKQEGDLVVGRLDRSSQSSTSKCRL